MRWPEYLRSLAQNDYMTDGNYLLDGKKLLKLADHIEDIEQAAQDEGVMQ